MLPLCLCNGASGYSDVQLRSVLTFWLERASHAGQPSSRHQ